MTMKKTLLLLSAIAYAAPLFAQVKIADLKKEDFIGDFDLAVKIIKKDHPNPFKFISEKEFDRKIDSLRKNILADPTVYGYIANSPVHFIRDVHSGEETSYDLGLDIFKSISYFPLAVFIERGRVFVNIKNKEVPFGSEILKINDLPIKQILQEIGSNVDGYIENGTDRMANDFVKVYSLRNRNIKNYAISFIKPGETKISNVVMKPVSAADYFYDSYKGVMPFNLLQRNSNVYSDFVDDKKLGVLTVNTFSLSETDAYKEFSQFFKEVNKKQYRDVVIDVRSNGGGDPAIAALLYSFIAKNSFSNVYSYKTKNITINNPEYWVDGNLRKYSDEDIRNVNNFYYQRFDKVDSTGWYVGNSRLMEGLLTNYPKDKDAFLGNVTILIGSGTISAGTYFASLVKMNKRGQIIGKETASGLDATTAAWFNTYQLPGTKSILRLPRTEIYFFNAIKDRGRGLLPDKELPVELFIKYVLANKDPEMSFAIEQIQKNQ